MNVRAEVAEIATDHEGAQRGVLRTEGLSKVYGDATVLTQFTIELKAGEVVALMGANGAGKSTAGKIIAGAVTPTGGTITADGRPVRPGNRKAAIRAGLQFVPQELDLCPDLKIWENIAISDERMRMFKVALNPSGARSRTQTLLGRVGASHLSPEVRVGSLTFAERQLVAIARALASDPKYIVFDEPTASLGREEAAGVTALIRRLAAQGVGCAFISHRIPEILSTCDSVVVLRDGRIVSDGSIADYDEASLERAMFGNFDAFLDAERESHRQAQNVALSVRHASFERSFREVDLDVAAGEIVGIYGLAGSGVSGLLRCIVGVHRLDEGEVTVTSRGSSRRLTSLHGARKSGVGFVSMDRKHEGIFAGHSTAVNIVAEQLSDQMRWVTPRAVSTAATAVGATAGLGDGGPIYSKNAIDLSGGQQQKALIARRMAGGSRVWVLDEPLGGIDIKTKRELATLFHERASRGDSFLVATGDLSDVAALCDRAVVMHGGRVVGEVDAVDAHGRVSWSDEKLNTLSTLAVRNQGELPEEQR